jgi:hypothetical protein
MFMNERLCSKTLFLNSVRMACKLTMSGAGLLKLNDYI